jgi:hypothetical protein
MGYYEGELSGIGGNNGFGGDGWWAIILFAMIFGWGRNGNGYGSGLGNGGSEVLGYELGKVATTNDVAAGFNNSAVLSNLNSLKEGQLQMINYNNQGFNGLNTSILTTGNTISREIADCCCATQRLIERGFCDLITNQNSNTQRIMDYMQNEKICSLQAENVALKGQISNNAQSAYIINSLNPPARPAYLVPNPNCCPAPCSGTGFNGFNGFNTII